MKKFIFLITICFTMVSCNNQFVLVNEKNVTTYITIYGDALTENEIQQLQQELISLNKSCQSVKEVRKGVEKFIRNSFDKKVYLKKVTKINNTPYGSIHSYSENPKRYIVIFIFTILGGTIFLYMLLRR